MDALKEIFGELFTDDDLHTALLAANYDVEQASIALLSRPETQQGDDGLSSATPADPAECCGDSGHSWCQHLQFNSMVVNY